MDFVKIRNFCSEKDNVKGMRRLARKLGEKNCKTHFGKRMHPKCTKNS